MCVAKRKSVVNTCTDLRIKKSNIEKRRLLLLATKRSFQKLIWIIFYPRNVPHSFLKFFYVANVLDYPRLAFNVYRTARNTIWDATTWWSHIATFDNSDGETFSQQPELLRFKEGKKPY